MKPLLLALAAALSVATLRAAEPPLFEGYMIAGDRPQFILSDGKGEKSGWLTLGDRFESFTLVALQADEEALLVEKDGKRQLLRLRKGTLLASKPDPLAVTVRSLTGFALAYELVKRESELTSRESKTAVANVKVILQRYEEALVASQSQKVDDASSQPRTKDNEEAIAFLKRQVERLASEAASVISAEAGKRSP